MGQQTLKTVITIGGHVDNSFGVIGETLMGLGSQIDGLSQKFINFGKESVTEFVNYDDIMREVKALGEFTDAEMQALDKINTEIARDKKRIYDNIQAAEAEVFLAQLGLNIKEIQTLLPDVLNLAAAGHLSIADSADYLYSSLKSLGLALTDSDELTDMMAKTASLGATDIDTLGQSLTRIGSGLKLFKGGAPEVLAMLSTISEYGHDMRGQSGGTRMRNFMLSLLAPAGAGNQVIAALENLGMTQEELNSYLEDEGIDLTSSAQAIKELGLQVFDEAGNVREATDIVVDLFQATKGMSDELRSKVLRQIFGRREFIMAQNLMDPLGTDIEHYDKLVDAIVKSEGYAGQMAETMQGGAGGALRSLDAAFSDLKKTVGELLEEDVIGVSGWLNDVVTGIAGLDEDKLSALVSGLGGIALAGPGLMLVGGAIRLMGFFATPAGAAAAALIIGAAAAKAFYDLALKAPDITASFGSMELDIAKLEGYAGRMETAFTGTLGQIAEFKTAADEASAKYEELTGTLSKELLDSTLSHQELSEADKKRLIGYGGNIIDAVREGIRTKQAESLSLTQILFGDRGSPEEEEAYRNLVDWEAGYYDELYAEAEAIGEGLRSSMVKALNDGELNEEERQAINSQLDRLNQIQAEIMQGLSDQAYYTQLRKAQDVSWDSMKDWIQSNEYKQAEELAAVDDMFYRKYGIAREAYERKKGSAQSGAERRQIEQDWQNIEAQLDREHQEYRASTQDKYGNLITEAFDALMHDSDYAQAWALIKQIRDEGLELDQYGRPDYFSIDWKSLFQSGVPEDIEEMLNRLDSDDSSWLGLGKGRLTGLLKDAAKDNPYVAEIVGMLESARDLTMSANAYINRQDRYEQTRRPYEQEGVDYYGEFSKAQPPVVEPEVVDGGPQGAAWKKQFEATAGNPTVNVKLNLGRGGGGLGVLSGAGQLMKMYADGGYADEPSIFGEDGGEWAIPERHDQRTAMLLDAAREGAGFTWGELITRNGGLNARGGQGIGQIVYSPRIYAQDARGVKEELEMDKVRFRRMLEEYQLTEAQEVYS